MVADDREDTRVGNEVTLKLCGQPARLIQLTALCLLKHRAAAVVTYHYDKEFLAVYIHIYSCLFCEEYL